METKAQNFKKELKALLEKYNAYIDVEAYTWELGELDSIDISVCLMNEKGASDYHVWLGNSGDNTYKHLKAEEL